MKYAGFAINNYVRNYAYAAPATQPGTHGEPLLNNTCCIKVALPTRMRVIRTYLHDPWNFIFQHAVRISTPASQVYRYPPA